MIESPQTNPQETRRLYIKKNTLISGILQGVSFKQYSKEAIAAYNAGTAEKYCDTGRKLTVVVQVQYFLLAALLECRSFREVADLGESYGLPRVDYSRLSRKAAELPYEIIQFICAKIYGNSPRKTRRFHKKTYGKLIQILDSTRITACKSKWLWAPYLKESSGIKFHTLFFPETGDPVKALGSEICQGDTAPMLEFLNPARILVADRGYMNIQKFCRMDEAKQFFVIRLREPVSIHVQRPAETAVSAPEGYKDDICTLGKGRENPKAYRTHEFRVVQFLGADGKMVKLCTNAYALSTAEIADIYRERWNIECFFRELKQNFQIKRLFGKSRNAAFSQGFVAFIAYLLMHTIYRDIKKRAIFAGTFSAFLRILHFDTLPKAKVSIRKILSSLFP